MALTQSALLELLDAMRSGDGGELIRRLLVSMLQLLIDAEAPAFIGAEPHERTCARTNQRNGTRDKLVATATGDLTVKIPKVRQGSFGSAARLGDIEGRTPSLPEMAICGAAGGALRVGNEGARRQRTGVRA